LLSLKVVVWMVGEVNREAYPFDVGTSLFSNKKKVQVVYL